MKSERQRLLRGKIAFLLAAVVSAAASKVK
jgi:hypothetical protein